MFILEIISKGKETQKVIIRKFDIAVEQMSNHINSLLSLEFQHEVLNDKHVEIIAHTIKNSKTLHTLNFRATKLSDASIAFLISAIKMLPHLKTLNLSWCNFTKTGFILIAEMLYENESIEKLFLGENHFSSESVDAFVKAILKNTTIKSLDLSDMKRPKKTFDLDAAKLLKAINLNPSLIDFNPDVGPLISKYKEVQQIMERNKAVCNEEVLHTKANMIRQILKLRNEAGLFTNMKDNFWKFNSVPTLKHISAFFVQVTPVDERDKIRILLSSTIDLIIEARYFPGIQKIRAYSRLDRGPVIYSDKYPSQEWLDKFEIAQIIISPFKEIPGAFYVNAVLLDGNEKMQRTTAHIAKINLTKALFIVQLNGDEIFYDVDKTEEGIWERGGIPNLDYLKNRVLYINDNLSGIPHHSPTVLLT